MAAARQLLHSTRANPQMSYSPSLPQLNFTTLAFHRHQCNQFSKLSIISGRRIPTIVCSALSGNDNIAGTDIDNGGIPLGTMKLPGDTDIDRFETLLFQWANSLSQGANLPLPVPLKVDKIKGGARLGFIKVEDGKTEVCAYIDCLVFPGTKDSGPMFRAVRNGTLKDQAPPGEPRIMRSLLQALKKSIEIARV